MRPEPPLPAPLISAVAELVRRRTGLVFGAARRVSLESGLHRVFSSAEWNDVDQCLAVLDADSARLDELVAAITVGETYFFREPAQFEHIRGTIVPDLVARWPREHVLRVWSAGCATGEEAYTLAIVLRELGLQDRAHILGTDLSRAALAAARRAEYSAWSLRGLPESVIARWFRRSGSRLQLAEAIRQAVDLRYLNLAEDVYPAVGSAVWAQDLVLCRNVLIYFDHDTVARVARRLLDSLSAHGWLVCGASDPPLHEIVACEAIMTPGGLVYRRTAPPSTRARHIETDHTPPNVAPEFAPARATPTTPPVAAEAPSESRIPTPESRLPRPDSRSPTPESRPPYADLRSAYAARDYTRAADLARTVIEQNANADDAWVALVRSLANLGDLEAAGRACAVGMERARESAELTYLHAVLLSETGRYRDAADAARRALYLDRHLVVAHIACGTALSRVGDVVGARRSFENARRLLEAMAPEDVVAASDGEPAGRLAAMVRLELSLLGAAA